MNKTIIININGIVFHIEEDAYEVLKRYMTEVKLHFAYSPDSEEIVTDIENRLAEMFTEHLNRDNKQVIVLQDVNEVTAQMGSASDFDLQDEEEVYPGGEFKSEKKLFRDMDDRIIGGVCAGIGHYFNIEPRWIRLVALLMFFFGGTGLMLYIILWIVMPKAITRVDKMAMKGEPINIQNFKKNFDEEFENLRHGINRARREANPLIDRLGNILGSIIRIIAKIAGAFVIFIGAMVLFGLVVALLTFLGFWDVNGLNTFPFSMVNPEYKTVLALSAFVLMAIPLAALVLFAIRVIFNRRVLTKTASFTMLIIWLTGLCLGVYFGSKVAAQFRDEATFSQSTEISASPVYYLKLNPVKYLTKEDSLSYNIDPGKFRGRVIIDGRNEDFDMPRNVSLRIEMSDVNKATLNQEFSAKGPDFETALRSAQLTHYQFIQKDSILQFDWNTRLRKNELWRDQSVNLTLRLPRNTRLIIDGKLNRYLQDYNLRDCQPEHSWDDASSEWIVTDEGLKCSNDSLYRKNRGELDSQQIR